MWKKFIEVANIKAEKRAYFDYRKATKFLH